MADAEAVKSEPGKPAEPHHRILGEAQRRRAEIELAKMPPAERRRMEKLLDNASDAERPYLMKGIATRHSAEELEHFDRKIKGRDEVWLNDHLSLTGNSHGRGVQQQWSTSCNATTAQAVRGELDPLYALRTHELNPNMTRVDDSHPTRLNPHLAEEQRAMLTSPYKGGVGGVAVARDQAGGQGRWADDLFNRTSDATGIHYTTKKIQAGETTVDASMRTIDRAMDRGEPVPIVIGDGGRNAYAHYVLVTGREDGPTKSYSIHDPWSGNTVARTEQQIRGGNINIAGWNQLGAVEEPSPVRERHDAATHAPHGGAHGASPAATPPRSLSNFVRPSHGEAAKPSAAPAPALQRDERQR
jgi:hypothetical protein